MPRFRVIRRISFQATHHLPFSPTLEAVPHPHRWLLEVCVEGDLLQEGGQSSGHLVDGRSLDEKLFSITTLFDGSNLNHFFDNPTPELFLCYLHDRLREKLAQTGFRPVWISLTLDGAEGPRFEIHP